MDVFTYNTATSKLEVDDFNILLIKEFGDLWDDERNKCKEDKTGKKHLKAYKELTYMFLALDFKSPYFKFTADQKHKDAMKDSGMTEEDFKDEKFKAAFRKYNEIQERDPILSLITTAYTTLYKMQVFFDGIDFVNDIDADGRPLYKPKDVLADIASIGVMREKLISLEDLHRKGLAEAGKKVRGDTEVGYDEM